MCTARRPQRQPRPEPLISFRQRPQLEIAEVDLEPLGLEQDLPGRGVRVVTLVDCGAVDDHRDALAFTDALDARPLAEWTLHVVLAPRVDQLLEVRVVLGPPELFAGIDRL